MSISIDELTDIHRRFGAGDFRVSSMTHDQEDDEAIPIILFQPDHRFDLDKEALKKILLKDEIKDRYVVILSVAGAFRKGKSFILDFFLRYVYHAYGDKSSSDSPSAAQWMGPADKPLEGFSWRGGSERDTAGILMWSKVFLSRLKSGEDVAILLLDTQGTFDSESTMRDSATVFALSTMISSIQVYNLSQNIQEDDLQHLQLFTEYGKIATEQVGTTPFQRLVFLVRDWSYPYEADYGDKGGQKILQKRLKIITHQHPELQSIRRHIKSCFSDISCFLMPHPGLKVATNPRFDGRLVDIEDDFKTQLDRLAVMLLAPENLTVKEIGGQKIKAKDLLQYFDTYLAVYSGDELPEPKTLLAATAEANHLAALAAAKDCYNNLMNDFCGGTKPFVNPSLLDAEHLRARVEAIKEFQSKRKMGSDDISETYRVQLESELEEMLQQFKRFNSSKNFFKSATTPSLFFGISIICYLLSGFFSLISLYPIANFFNLGLILSLLTLATWTYIKYSGEMPELGENIDAMSISLLDGAVKPIFQAVICQLPNQFMRIH